MGPADFQVHTFYEAVGYMISAQPNKPTQERLIDKLMELPNNAVRLSMPVMEFSTDGAVGQPHAASSEQRGCFGQPGECQDHVQHPEDERLCVHINRTIFPTSVGSDMVGHAWAVQGCQRDYQSAGRGARSVIGT